MGVCSQRAAGSFLFAAALVLAAAHALLGQQSSQQSQKQQWKAVPFAIGRSNDDAPKSWNVYHAEKKGIYLVRLWKRYLLIDTNDQSAYEIDPSKVRVTAETAEIASADIRT